MIKPNGFSLYYLNKKKEHFYKNEINFYLEYFVLFANSCVGIIDPLRNKIGIVSNGAGKVINCFSYKILSPE